MRSKAETIAAYLAELSPERRKALSHVREVILKNLPKGYEEGMQYGAIGYFVPHALYPPGYHCNHKQPLPFAGLASQKNHISLYLMSIYGDPKQMAWFRRAWLKTGKKLNSGKSCLRFKTVDDIPLGVIGQAIKRVTVKRFIQHCEAVRRS